MTLYKRFRGQEPTIEALLKRNGIKIRIQMKTFRLYWFFTLLLLLTGCNQKDNVQRNFLQRTDVALEQLL